MAVIGDSPSLHPASTADGDGLEKAPATVVILDNRITAMTGRQENPASGFTLSGDETSEVNIPELCRVWGIKHVPCG